MSDSKCPYSDEELREIKFLHHDNDLYLAHPNHPVYVIRNGGNFRYDIVKGEYMCLTKDVIAELAEKLEPGDK